MGIGTLETLIMWQAKRITSFKNVQHVFARLRVFLSKELAVYADARFGSSLIRLICVMVLRRISDILPGKYSIQS